MAVDCIVVGCSLYKQVRLVLRETNHVNWSQNLALKEPMVHAEDGTNLNGDVQAQGYSHYKPYFAQVKTEAWIQEAVC